MRRGNTAPLPFLGPPMQTTVSYIGQIETAPGLFLAAGTCRRNGQVFSGTGVSANRDQAAARCRAEQAEALALHAAGVATHGSAPEPGAVILGSAAASTKRRPLPRNA